MNNNFADEDETFIWTHQDICFGGSHIFRLYSDKESIFIKLKNVWILKKGKQILDIAIITYLFLVLGLEK